MSPTCTMLLPYLIYISSFNTFLSIKSTTPMHICFDMSSSYKPTCIPYTLQRPTISHESSYTDLFPTVGVMWASGLGMSMVTGSAVWLPARRCRRKSQFSSHESASTTMSPGLTAQHSLSEQESGKME